MWSYHWPPDYSGAGLQARRLGRLLAQRGWPVWALASSAAHARVTETDDEGMRVVWVPRVERGRLLTVAARTIARYARALARRRGEFDILHIHSAFLDAALGATLARLWGKGCLVKNTLTGVDLAPFGHGLWGRWQRWAFGSVGAFVGPSQSAADEFIQVGLPAARVHRIPNGVDTDLFRPAAPGERDALRARLGLPAEARIALNLSAITARKGTETLIEALARLAPRHPDLHLALVGPWERAGRPLEGDAPEWFPRLRQRIAALGLADRVHIPGAQPNAPEWLRAADLFVFPAVNEGLPNAVLEAMATGLPVVACDIPTLREAVRPGETGLLAPAADAAAFAATMERVLTDAALGGRLGEAARGLAVREFSLTRVVEAYERIYHALTASRSPEDTGPGNATPATSDR